jgi:hypothetical protein
VAAHVHHSVHVALPHAVVAAVVHHVGRIAHGRAAVACAPPRLSISDTDDTCAKMGKRMASTGQPTPRESGASRTSHAIAIPVVATSSVPTAAVAAAAAVSGQKKEEEEDVEHQSLR